MKNFEYIVASLPAVTQDWKFTDSVNADTLVKEIREHCDRRDNALIDFLLDGFREENLDEAFYTRALAHRNRFIRDYFRMDLAVRNAKVRYLNKRLGRPAGQDCVTVGEEQEAPSPAIDALFATEDLLEREKRIDTFLWNRIQELTVADLFDIEFLLGFIARLHIINRWFLLDEGTGREMFRKLVDEVRGTFRGVEYDAASTE